MMTTKQYAAHLARLEYDIALYGYSVVFGFAEQYHVWL